jgi:transcriptional regulator with XRE-family HTH domain
MQPAKSLTNVDTAEYIATKLKVARQHQKVSQQKCGKLLGVSTQQYQKYETGGTRLSAADLFVIADHLQQPIESFFPRQNGTEDAIEVLATSRETVLAADAFNGISDSELRDRMLGLLRTLSRKKEVTHA